MNITRTLGLMGGLLAVGTVGHKLYTQVKRRYSNSANVSIGSLPPEINLLILRHLDTTTQTNLREVNTFYRDLVDLNEYLYSSKSLQAKRYQELQIATTKKSSDTESEISSLTRKIKFLEFKYRYFGNLESSSHFAERAFSFNHGVSQTIAQNQLEIRNELRATRQLLSQKVNQAAEFNDISYGCSIAIALLMDKQNENMSTADTLDLRRWRVIPKVLATDPYFSGTFPILSKYVCSISNQPIRKILIRTGFGNNTDSRFWCDEYRIQEKVNRGELQANQFYFPPILPIQLEDIRAHMMTRNIQRRIDGRLDFYQIFLNKAVSSLQAVPA